MFSIISRNLSYLVLLTLFVCSLHAAIELSFFNNIPNTPHETIVFASESLFYTGGLAHIDEFICTSDSPSTETVLWFDARGNEVSVGDGSGTSLYWTGSTSNKTLHTSDSAGNNLIDVDNQGNNFTCRVSETSEEKVFGIYWVRSILDADGGVTNQLEGMRIYTKDEPPIISEFTLQRGFFNLDFTKQYKVQSLIGSTSITFSPDPIAPATIPAQSIIDNVKFSSSRNCQVIGTSSNDLLYTTLFNGYYIPSTTYLLSLPQLAGATCMGNGTQTTSSLGDLSPDIRYTCPLVFNGNFINIDDLNLLTENQIVASSDPELPQINGRRLWVDFDSSISTSLRYDREYVCEDMYGTRLIFNIRIRGNHPLEILVSDLAKEGTLVATNYIGTEIPEILYCLAETDTIPITWLSDTNANYTTSVSPLEVTTSTSIIPYRITPRTGRSDMFLNSTIALDREGYYTCSDGGTNDIRVGIFSLDPEAPIAMVAPSELSQNISFISPINITCDVMNSAAHPPPIFFWTGPRTSSTGLLDTTGFQEADSGDYTCHASNVVGSSNITISILIVIPPPMLVANTTYSPLFFFEDLFITDTFELFCEFSTLQNVTSSILIQWYHNTSLSVETGITTVNGYSTLVISNANVSNSGDYHCVATVGGSLPANSSPIQVTVNDAYAPDAISLTLNSITVFAVLVSWNATVMSPALSETYTSSISRVGSSEEVINTIPMGSTTLTKRELLPNSEYKVYLNATNRFFTTQGSTALFKTSSHRLYFMKGSDLLPIGAGSIFRGGKGSNIFDYVSEYHCYPDSSAQVITWYQPNGDVIPPGDSSSSGFYHIRNSTTGKSVFYPNDAVSYENEGNNYTCSFIGSSGENVISQFGIYYAKVITGYNTLGIRIYGPEDLIYEFVWQRGVFDFDFTQNYTVECLRDTIANTNHWRFTPPSNKDTATLNVTLYDIQFDPDATCQYIRCAPFVQFITFSDKPFLVETGYITDSEISIPFIGCLANNYVFNFQIGDSIDTRVTCPLVFGAHFLDIGSDLTLIEDRYTAPRRLFIDPVTIATLRQDREFVCEDMYGVRASFRFIVNGNDPIQVLASADSTVPEANNTILIGDSNIPDSLFCITGDESNAANWYVDSNPNRNTAESGIAVTADSTQLPYVLSPRTGRSDLVLNGTITDGAEGYYSCVTNPQITLGIFLEIPVAPQVAITGNEASIQVVISITTLTLVCDVTNIPYPNPIYFWTGSVSSSTALLDTSLLLESDSGVYTCTASNVVGLSTDTVTITVIPPPPEFVSIQLVTSRPIYVSDSYTLQCQFNILSNVTSQINFDWYRDGTLVANSSSDSIVTTNTGAVGTSELTVSNSMNNQEDYQCRSTVGASQQTDSDIYTFNFTQPPTPILIVNPVDPPDLYVTQTINITCQVTTLARFQDGLSIVWNHNGSILNANGDITNSTINLDETTIESTIIFVDLVIANTGAYHCVAQVLGVLNSEGVSSTTNIQVIPIPAPQFIAIQLMTSQPIYVTDTFTLQCQFSTVPNIASQINVEWYRDGTLVANSGSDNIVTTNTGNIGTSELTVSNSMIDQEVYHCRSTVGASQQTDSDIYTFNFTQPPTPILIVDPVDPPDLYVTQAINITCQVTTLARFQDGLNIVWYDNGGILNVNGDVSNSTINLNETAAESTLIFVNLVIANTGAYHCVAQVLGVLNSEQGVSSTTNIQVIQIPAPQFIAIQLVTQQPIYVTDTFTLQCQFSTVPNIASQIVIDWYRDGTLVVNSGSDSIVATNTGTVGTSELTVSNSMIDQEDYQCRSIVGASQSTDSDIYIFNFTPPTPMPNINPVDPPDLYVTQTINITCQVTTLARFQSGLNIVWYHNGGILNANGDVSNSTRNLNETTTESTLIFVDLVIANTGAYHCVAQVLGVLNSEEGVSSTTNIQVIPIPAPQFIAIQLVTQQPIYVTDTFTLQCQFSTVPNIASQIVIDWYRDGTLVANSGSNSIVTTKTGNIGTSELTVSNSMNNQEAYQCRSTVGASQQTDSDIYTFNFTQPPTPIPNINPVDPPDLYVTQTINITCQVTTLARSQDGLNIVWYHNGGILNANGDVTNSTINLDETTTESTLIFVDLVIANTGAYHCVAQVLGVLNSEEGVSSTTNIQVIPIPAPQFIAIQLVTQQPIYVTDTFTLQCQFSTVPNIASQIVIDWYRDGTLVANSGSNSIVTTKTGSIGTSELTVSNSMIDQEVYHCRSTVGASQQTDSDIYTFNFTQPPTPIPNINPVDPPDLYVTQTINITCQVTTLARFQDGLNIVWYHNGGILNANGDLSNSTINLDETTLESTLIFIDLVIANTGVYHCVAQVLGVLNSEEGVSSTTNIQVIPIPAPQFIAIQLVTQQPIYVTDTFTLQCQFSTVPNIASQINVDWYRDGTLVANSGSDNIVTTNTGNIGTSELTVSNSMIDQEVYHCRSTVGASQPTDSDIYTFNFTPPPTPILIINPVDPPDLYVTQTINIRCQITTLARFRKGLIIIWYHNDSFINTNVDVTISAVILNETSIQSTLFFADIVIANTGAYHCVAQVLGILNSEQRVSSTTNVQVNLPPSPIQDGIIYRDFEYDLFEGYSFHLHCDFMTLGIFQSILHISWYRDDIQIHNSTADVTIITVDKGMETKLSKITITDAKLNDTGAYSCEGSIESYARTRSEMVYNLTINPTDEIPAINILTTDLSTNSITFQLTTSNNIAETYLIYYRPAGTEPFQVSSPISTLSSITIGDLLAGTEYEYIIETTTQFGSTNSSLYTVSTVSQPTGESSSLIGPVVGVLLALLFLGILLLIVILLIIFLYRKRSKKYVYHHREEHNQGYRGRDKSRSSQRPLLSTSGGIGLNVGTSAGHGQFVASYDEVNAQKTSTFRKSVEIQETIMVNQEPGAEPVYEDFSFETYNVPVEIFSQKVLEYHLANNAEFQKQYSSLRKNFIHDVTTGSNAVNKQKNRFANIIPYEHSRVKLSFTGEKHSDYINACYIDGYYKPQSYIASQGPMPHTVKDFWRMIWEKNIEHIVALTRVMEALKKKCEQYWPENENESSTYGPMEVTLKKVDRYTSYDIRVLEVKHEDYDSETRVVIQFHFTMWPDHGVPIFSSSLLSFINHTKEYHIPGKSQSPMLVHCSAGVGRTGTFIVLDYFLEHLKDHDKINIYRLVAQLRESRCLMVQTKDQYMFIHDAIQDVITCKDNFIGDHEFQIYVEYALIRDLKTMTTPFEDKYELIMKTSRIVDPRDIHESSDVANVMKNRYPNFVPFDSHRVTITPDQDGEKDYVNASFVHSYQKHKGFIAAQSPIDLTVYDFWKMITKYRIQLIVMLSDLVEDGHEMCARYWPEEGKEMLVNFLVIRCEKEEVFDEYVRRKFVVSTQQGGLNQTIQQIQFMKWKINELPEITDLLILYHEFTLVERAIKSKESPPILVHCDNGVTRTGTFIASVIAIQQLELERKADIFQIVRNLRNSRPCMVPSLDLYILLFKLISSYIQSYEEKAYANFV